jgi:hypothetical protein
MVFWMLPPQSGLAAPMVVGSSLVTNLTVSRALTAWAGAVVGWGAAVGCAGAGVAVGSMANGAGRATSGAAGASAPEVSAGWAGSGGAAVPQATIRVVTKAAKLSSHLLFALFVVIMTCITLLLHNLLRSENIIFHIWGMIIVNTSHNRCN